MIVKALLYVLMAVDIEYYGLQGVTLVLKQMTAPVCVWVTDPTATFDNIKEQRDRFSRMKLTKTLDATSVRCCIRGNSSVWQSLYANVLILYPGLDNMYPYALAPLHASPLVYHIITRLKSCYATPLIVAAVQSLLVFNGFSESQRVIVHMFNMWLSSLSCPLGDK